MDPSTIPLGKFLGQGTYGKVYEVDVMGKKMALKKIDSDTYEGLQEIGELVYLRMLDHPNIIHCDAFTVAKEGLGIVLPLANRDLQGELSMKKHSHNDIIKWMYQILSAVHFLHKNGYFHCDIKPQNILMVGDDAIVADLGLLGDKHQAGNACQSLASPQRMYQNSRSIASPIIAKKKTNEYKDDIWAIGMTFYMMIMHDYPFPFSGYPIFYMKDPETYLRDKKLPEPYMTMMLRLLHPDPDERGFNLLELLTLPIFSSYHNYVNGTIIKVDNKRPVLFDATLTQVFKKAIKMVIAEYIDGTIKAITTANTIDLLYRIYEMIPKSKQEFENYFNTCLYISQKLFKNNPNTAFLNKMAEVNIMKWTDGFITRDLILSYISEDQYPIFFDWIAENPEKYEQYSLETLAIVIRTRISSV